MTQVAVAAHFHSRTGHLSVDGTKVGEFVTNLSEASERLERKGYTLVGSWTTDDDGQTFTHLVEEAASVAHVWPGSVDFLELAHLVEHMDTGPEERGVLVGLLHSLDVARNTWDSFPVRYPDFPADKRNQHLVGTLAALIGRAKR